MRRTIFALLLAVVAAPAVANAQNEPTAQASATPPAGDPLAKENWPLSGVDRPLGVSGGMLQVDVNSNIAMSKGGVAKPINLPLAVWYGITNELQFGLVHGTGLCLSGKDNGCGKVYNDLGLNLLFSLFGRGSNLEIGTWTTLNFLALDPATLQLQVGGAANWVVGGFMAILPYPYFGIGLNKREAPFNNKETFGMPVSVYFRASPNISPVLFTGIGGTPLDGFGDKVTVPVGVGLLVAINNTIDVGGRFDFLNLLGKGGSADVRSLGLWLSLRPL